MNQLIASILILSATAAFAEGPAPTAAPAATVKKVSKKEAKKACLAEGKKIGEELKKCIESKTM